jgi:hypothetical protein
MHRVPLRIWSACRAWLGAHNILVVLKSKNQSRVHFRRFKWPGSQRHLCRLCSVSCRRPLEWAAFKHRCTPEKVAQQSCFFTKAYCICSHAIFVLRGSCIRTSFLRLAIDYLNERVCSLTFCSDHSRPALWASRVLLPSFSMSASSTPTSRFAQFLLYILQVFNSCDVGLAG